MHRQILCFIKTHKDEKYTFCAQQMVGKCMGCDYEEIQVNLCISYQLKKYAQIAINMLASFVLIIIMRMDDCSKISKYYGKFLFSFCGFLPCFCPQHF